MIYEKLKSSTTELDISNCGYLGEGQDELVKNLYCRIFFKKMQLHLAVTHKLHLESTGKLKSLVACIKEEIKNEL